MYRTKFNEYVIENDIVKIKLFDKEKNIIYTTIDLEYLQKLISLGYRWYARYQPHISGYYAQSNLYFNGKHSVICLHQFVLNHFDRYYQIDHINKNPLDNRKDNLRIASIPNNSRNRRSKNSNNKSGHRNVCFYNDWYLVQLQVNGKNKVILKTKNYDEACITADEARIKYYGEFAGDA